MYAMDWGSVRGVGVAVVLGAVSAAAQQVPGVVVPDTIAVATFANLTGTVEDAWMGRGMSPAEWGDSMGPALQTLEPVDRDRVSRFDLVSSSLT